MAYHPRLIDQQLKSRLNSAGAVLLEGAKACGKTETATQFAQSTARLDTDPQIGIQMELDPSKVLEGLAPRLLDEWQEHPAIWNYVRREVDVRKEKGQFILTGSAHPAEEIRRHSGAGRFSRLKMRTMSLCECGWSSGEVSLQEIMNDAKANSDSVDFELSELIERVTFGGWPGLIDNASLGDARLFSQDYVAQIAEADLSKLANRRRDPIRVRRLINSLARNISTEASLIALARDSGGNESPLNVETARTYLDALEDLMIVEPLPAWSTHIRSSDTLRKAAKWHFVDPSLAIGALGLSPQRLSDDLQYFGLLFESLAIRDLRIYAELFSARVFHYRDSRGVEADAIVETPSGEWMAFEVKLGFSAVEDAAENLKTLAEKIDTNRSKKPSALVIITANGFAHRRKDGVFVVPLATLTA